MSKEGTQDAVNLYLVGFMGVGKSAVGRSVARYLGMRFLDSDRVIENSLGMPIREFFAREGEASFRARERAFVESGHPARGCVIACGGGLPIPPGMIELLRERGVVVCLFARTDTILARTASSQKRPLLNVDDPASRVKDLLREREPIYMRAGPGICTENRSIQEVVSHVVRLYRREARDFTRRQQKETSA